MKFGLLGQHLSHSYSPKIHSLLANYQYGLFDIEPDELESFLRSDEFSGLNVTMPYKKAVIPYLDQLSPIAAKLGAVNTIVRRDGKLIGHNTDYYGLYSTVQNAGLTLSGKKCLVLGSGGASNTAVAVLKEFGGNVIVISRTGENNYQNLQLHNDASIIVNATPVGMYPDQGHRLVDLSIFYRLECVLDVIYNPSRTQILLDAEKLGIPSINGLWMLVAQAKETAEWFTETDISNEKLSQAYKVLRSQMENIILIGMPGCGKTTIGKLLAQKTGRQFIDIDAEIEIITKKTIPTIFSEDGEGVFRHLETEVIERYGRESGLIIATGGGCITKERNYPLLHQNGSIFWLKRDIECLPTEGRPLSQTQDLHRMYETRKPLYAQFADHIICNNRTPVEAVESILEVLQ